MSRRSDVSLKNSVRRGQEGNATVKFLAVVVVLFLVAFGGYNYLITWYEVTQFQDSMKQTIDRANMSVKAVDSDVEKIREYLKRKATENNVPPNAVIRVEKNTNGTTANATFVRDVAILPLNLYKYKYQVNYTVGPVQGWLTKP